MEKFIWSYIFILLSTTIFSENIEFNVEGYGALSSKGDNLTQWMYSGKNGIYNKFDEKVGTFFDYKGNFQKIEVGTKVKVSSSDNESFLEIKEIYAEKKWKNYLTLIGKKSYEKANEKSELSSGSLLVSENAESPFRIHFGTNGYIPVWKTNGRLMLSASMSNSMLESNRVCKTPYLHEKEAYLKLKTGEKSSVYGGVSHVALWGGELNGEKINSTFMDFISVLIVDNKGNNGIQTEVENKIGDHKGIYEFGYNRELENKKINLYYQHFFEDRDGMKFDNINDMLLGLNLKSENSKYVKEMVIEYLYNKNQGGTGTHLETGGQDYDYENYLYGPWTYKDMVIGNSLFITEGSGKDLKMMHTRIRAFHLGVSGNFSDNIKYKTKLSYTENCGTFANLGTDLFTNGKKQWYTYFEVEKNKLFNNENLSGIMGIGYDDGEIYNRAGIISSLKYAF